MEAIISNYELLGKLNEATKHLKVVDDQSVLVELHPHVGEVAKQNPSGFLFGLLHQYVEWELIAFDEAMGDDPGWDGIGLDEYHEMLGDFWRS